MEATSSTLQSSQINNPHPPQPLKPPTTIGINRAFAAMDNELLQNHYTKKPPFYDNRVAEIESIGATTVGLPLQKHYN